MPTHEPLKTLADFTLPHMVLNCSACGRKGRYNVARLIEKHGADMPIRDFIDLIGQTCPRWVRPSKWESCGLGCNDLIYMFSPLPGKDGYSDERG
ncbi:hypothetical protein [Sinorhizobium meliloti]|uniref:hypothetical protein n=1 Tax=Rhizobium meliloti TaxID=382 RepID=UPI0013E2DD63|nr:hypothetical protein [Sinorhizobium meliloti]